MSIVYFRFGRYFGPAQAAVGLQRAPLLEQLLAGAAKPTCVLDWRADAFRLLAPRAASMPGIAAVALRAEFGPVDGHHVCMASPLHCVAAMSSVRLPSDGILRLDVSEAEALARDFNRVFRGGDVRLRAGATGALYCLFDRALEVAARDPEQALDRDIVDYLPAGTDAAVLLGLMSEIEMWLFEHPVNRVRAARGAATVSGLWLWGGGASLSCMPAVSGWTAGNDALFAAFGDRQEFVRDAGAGVVVAQASPAAPQWSDVERRWLGPVLDELRAGGLQELHLSAADRCFSVRTGRRRGFWRRKRPWWEYFA